MKPEDDHKPLNYDYIDDGIYIGNNKCCVDDFDNEIIKKEGINADFSLQEKHIDQPFGIQYYTWLPVKNHTPPDQGQMAFGVHVLKHLVEHKIKVYVHCRNGHGRAPTLVSAYFIKEHGMSAQEAIDFVKSKRPSMHLDDEQIEALKEFQKNHE